MRATSRSHGRSLCFGALLVPGLSLQKGPWASLSLLFKGQWRTPGEGLHPSCIIPGGGKGPFLFPYLFMMRWLPKPITSATVMADLIHCDGGSTTRAAWRATEVWLRFMPHYTESRSASLHLPRLALVWHRFPGFIP